MRSHDNPAEGCPYKFFLEEPLMDVDVDVVLSTLFGIPFPNKSLDTLNLIRWLLLPFQVSWKLHQGTLLQSFGELKRLAQ